MSCHCTFLFSVYREFVTPVDLQALDFRHVVVFWPQLFGTREGLDGGIDLSGHDVLKTRLLPLLCYCGVSCSRSRHGRSDACRGKALCMELGEVSLKIRL